MIIGIDIGGTNIAFGLMDTQYNMLCKGSIKTPRDVPAEDLVQQLIDGLHTFLADNNKTMADIKWIGIGCPGSIDAENGIVLYANNLPFKNLPMARMISGVVGKPVYLGNDANCAALGEVVAGAAKGKSSAVVVTLGTGVGGGIIVDKKIVVGFNGIGGEIGHMGIAAGGRPCTCGRKGCFEAYSSATALIIMTEEALEKYPDSAMHKMVEADGKVSGRTAYAVAKDGDKAALEVVAEYEKYLAYGLANIVNIFQPDVICLGGGVAKEGERLLAPLRELVAAQSYGHGTGVPETQILAAALGNDAGIIGAAALGNQ